MTEGNHHGSSSKLRIRALTLMRLYLLFFTGSTSSSASVTLQLSPFIQRDCRQQRKCNFKTYLRAKRNTNCMCHLHKPLWKPSHPADLCAGNYSEYTQPEKANILTALWAVLMWMVSPQNQNTLKLTLECFYTLAYVVHTNLVHARISRADCRHVSSTLSSEGWIYNKIFLVLIRSKNLPRWKQEKHTNMY